MMIKILCFFILPFALQAQNDYPKLLDKIKFKNGYIKIGYANDRKDLYQYRISTLDVVETSGNALIKKFEFNQSYFFSNQNDDRINTPAVFKSLAADTRINFCLAQVDPAGRRTTGIIRKHTNATIFNADDRMKNSFFINNTF